MISPQPPRPLRPLWFLPEYPPNPGGIGSFARLVCEQLARQGDQPHLLVGWGGPSRVIEAGVEVIREPLRGAFEARRPAAVMGCRRIVASLKEEIRPDLYHVHLSDPSPLLHLATREVAAAPTCLTLHNQMLGLFDGRDPASLLSRLMVEARVITGVSTAVVVEAARARPDLAHRMVTIANGVPIGETSPLPAEPRLLAIGRLMPQKGFARLLRALPGILARHHGVCLDVIGEGPERQRLEALAGDLNVAEHIRFHGWVDRSLVPGFLARATMVVAPSLYEGLPYALLEAAAAGRPIVASNVGGIDQLVVDGQTGILVDEEAMDRNPGVLAEAVSDLLADQERALRFGAAGRERVRQHFSIESCTAAYVHLYRAVTAPEMDVAVIIPAWNAGRHLGAALESALREAHSVEARVQILVVDDGSSDDTAAVAALYGAQGVELFRQPHGGSAMARNAGLALTHSRYVAQLDADDLWPPGRLTTLLSTLESQPDLDGVFGQAVEFADPDAPCNARWNPQPAVVRLPTTGLVRRSAHERLGGFPVGRPHCTFTWMAEALARGFRYATIDQVVLQRRIHATNLSHSLPFLADRLRVAELKKALDLRRRATPGQQAQDDREGRPRSNSDSSHPTVVDASGAGPERCNIQVPPGLG